MTDQARALDFCRRTAAPLLEIATREVCSLGEEDTLGAATALMAERRISSGLVADGSGRPAGIVTERDVVRAMHAGSAPETPLARVMSAPLVSVPEDIGCEDAYLVCLHEGIRHLVLVDRAGALTGVVSDHDLTESMALGLIDAKQEDDRLFLRGLIDAIPDLVWLKKPDGRYLACNPRFERSFGARELEILGKTDYDFVDAGLADMFRANDRKAMRKGGPNINEEWIRFADDGHSELLQTIKTPMRDAAGELIGVLGT